MDFQIWEMKNAVDKDFAIALFLPQGELVRLCASIFVPELCFKPGSLKSNLLKSDQQLGLSHVSLVAGFLLTKT